MNTGSWLLENVSNLCCAKLIFLQLTQFINDRKTCVLWETDVYVYNGNVKGRI